MESIAVWQGATLGGIVAWILISSYQRHPQASIFPATLGGSPCHRWDSSHLPDPGFIQLLQL